MSDGFNDLDVPPSGVLSDAEKDMCMDSNKEHLFTLLKNDLEANGFGSDVESCEDCAKTV